ncbi:MAG: NTP transferase domain-containing protein [Gemmatimonadota bacterium]
MSQVIILAAGMGRRLGTLTEARPKAVVEVAGQPLITHTLRFAQRVGFLRRIVVSGFHASQLRRCVEAVDPQAIVTETPSYRAGNVHSLLAGTTALHPGGFLLMNVDHIYAAPVADIVHGVAEGATDVTAFVDFDRTLGPDDMKVELLHGRVDRMSKTLQRWDAGYVGMTFVPGAVRDAYLAVAHQALNRHGPAVNVEQLLNDLAGGGIPPVIQDISGVGWWEVDDESDRTAAEAALSGRTV